MTTQYTRYNCEGDKRQLCAFARCGFFTDDDAEFCSARCAQDADRASVSIEAKLARPEAQEAIREIKRLAVEEGGVAYLDFAVETVYGPRSVKEQLFYFEDGTKLNVDTMVVEQYDADRTMVGDLGFAGAADDFRQFERYVAQAVHLGYRLRKPQA